MDRAWMQTCLASALTAMVCGSASGGITYSRSDRGAIAQVNLSGSVIGVNKWISGVGEVWQWSHVDRSLGAGLPAAMASATFNTWSHPEFLELQSSASAYYSTPGPVESNAWARTDAHMNFTIDRAMRVSIQRHGPGLEGSKAFHVFEFTGPSGMVITDSGWDLFSTVLAPGEYHLRIVSDMLLPDGVGEGYAAQSYYFLLGSKDGVPTPGSIALLGAGLVTLRRRR